VSGATHETLKAGEDVKMGSEKSFGLVFAAVFGLVTIWPFLFGDGGIRWWALGVALVFLALAFLYPKALGPLNRAWFLFGMLLSKVMSPIVMGLLFVVAVVPTAIVMRLRGHDLLAMKLDREAESYWIRRDPKEFNPKSMERQF